MPRFFNLIIKINVNYSTFSARIKEFLLPENEEKEIVIDQCNAFLRKLIFQVGDLDDDAYYQYFL